MKKWANNNWEDKDKTFVPVLSGKKFKVEYFFSFTNEPQFKIVRAKDSQEAIAKFQQAVKWDYNKIGTIKEVK